MKVTKEQEEQGYRDFLVWFTVTIVGWCFGAVFLAKDLHIAGVTCFGLVPFLAMLWMNSRERGRNEQGECKLSDSRREGQQSAHQSVDLVKEEPNS